MKCILLIFKDIQTLDDTEQYVSFYRDCCPFSFCLMPLFLGEVKKRERDCNFVKIINTVLYHPDFEDCRLHIMLKNTCVE